MHSARAAGRDDDGLRARYHEFLGFHVHEDRARAFAGVVEDELDRGGEAGICRL